MPALAKPRPPGAPRWGDLGKRSLSALLLAPIALACIWLGAEPWTGLMALAAAGLSFEWVALCRAAPWRMPGLSVPMAVLLGGLVAVADHEALAVLVLAAGGLAVWRLSGSASLASGVMYVGLGAVALVWLRGSGGVGRANVLFLVLVVWASDIGAYVAGRLFGGPKLAPSISPGKTRSGAAGGLVASMLVGVAAAVAVAPASPVRAALVAAGLGVSAQAGDLLESWIKRRFGVKDSGRLIPGHGGLLDRLDGLLTAAPAAVALSLAIGRGEVLWQ